MVAPNISWSDVQNLSGQETEAYEEEVSLSLLEEFEEESEPLSNAEERFSSDQPGEDILHSPNCWVEAALDDSSDTEVTFKARAAREWEVIRLENLQSFEEHRRLIEMIHQQLLARRAPERLSDCADQPDHYLSTLTTSRAAAAAASSMPNDDDQNSHGSSSSTSSYTGSRTWAENRRLRGEIKELQARIEQLASNTATPDKEVHDIIQVAEDQDGNQRSSSTISSVHRREVEMVLFENQHLRSRNRQVEQQLSIVINARQSSPDDDDENPSPSMTLAQGFISCGSFALAAAAAYYFHQLPRKEAIGILTHKKKKKKDWFM